jgi:hypothetical protein
MISKALGFALLLFASSGVMAQQRGPVERIDLPGSWRCLTPRGSPGSLTVTAQGDFTLDGFTSSYRVEGRILSAVSGGVTTQYRVRQAGNALTLEGPTGRYSCQRGGSGPMT